MWRVELILFGTAFLAQTYQLVKNELHELLKAMIGCEQVDHVSPRDRITPHNLSKQVERTLQRHS